MKTDTQEAPHLGPAASLGPRPAPFPPHLAAYCAGHTRPWWRGYFHISDFVQNTLLRIYVCNACRSSPHLPSVSAHFIDEGLRLETQRALVRAYFRYRVKMQPQPGLTLWPAPPAAEPVKFTAQGTVPSARAAGVRGVPGPLGARPGMSPRENGGDAHSPPALTHPCPGGSVLEGKAVSPHPSAGDSGNKVP